MAEMGFRGELKYFCKRILLGLLDFCLLNCSILSALILLFGANIPAAFWDIYTRYTAFYSGISIACFYLFGLYDLGEISQAKFYLLKDNVSVGKFPQNRIWYFAGVPELKVILKAVTISALLCGVLFYRVLSWNGVVLTWILAVMMIAGSRFFLRVVRERNNIGGSKRVLLVGAGGAGALVARALQENKSNLCPVGFIDDDKQKLGMKLCGLTVLGTRRDIPEVVHREKVEEIIITMPSAPASVIKEIVNISKQTPARLKIIPSVLDYIGASRGRERLRDIDVEDLLGREPVRVNLRQIAGYLENKVVLVTGAGGSIGSELCRQIAGFNPKLLILLGRGENSIFEIKQHLEYDFPRVKTEARIVDVKDRYKIEKVFALYRPQVVFHAAAHKHVSLMESEPDEAFKNNVLGTLNVALAACKCNSEIFILISTDKAVNPTSVMGATKKVAEQIIQSLNRKYSTRLAAVRFGNVLGSRGSVVPLFKKQIARGGPVTVTHPAMVRYFMTVQEAVQLVIQAGALARGGEVFFLDMGKPVKIVDLARELIALSGYIPEQEIPIKFTGIRPGEKLVEELWAAGGEEVRETAHPRIYEVTGRQEVFDIDKLIDARETLCGEMGEREARDLLWTMVRGRDARPRERGGELNERHYREAKK